MARQTFQARLRSTAGTPRSVIDRRVGKPVNVGTYNPAGPIQFHVDGLASTTVQLGFIPGGFCIDRIALLLAGGAGTYDLTLPAYGDEVGVALVEDGDATSLADATLAPPRYSVWPEARPLTITGTGVTGLINLGLFGFPLDNTLSNPG